MSNDSPQENFNDPSYQGTQHFEDIETTEQSKGTTQKEYSNSNNQMSRKSSNNKETMRHFKESSITLQDKEWLDGNKWIPELRYLPCQSNIKGDTGEDN